jgi:hypothetical protein
MERQDGKLPRCQERSSLLNTWSCTDPDRDHNLLARVAQTSVAPSFMVTLIVRTSAKSLCQDKPGYRCCSRRNTSLNPTGRGVDLKHYGVSCQASCCRIDSETVPKPCPTSIRASRFLTRGVTITIRGYPAEPILDRELVERGKTRRTQTSHGKPLIGPHISPLPLLGHTQTWRITSRGYGFHSLGIGKDRRPQRSARDVLSWHF